MIELIISGVAVALSFLGMMVARHYYLETKEIERRFRDRRKEQSGSKSIRNKTEEGGSPPRYSA